MCLLSKRRFPKKAKRDITCYKVLEVYNENYYTPYIDIPVDINQEFIAEGISLSFKESYKKGKGYIHSFIVLPYRKELKNCFPFSNLAVFKCIIPKGTKYHMGDNYDICSKKIIFKNQIPSYMIK